MTRLITIFDKNLNQRVFRLFDENEIVHKIDTNLTISASSASIDVGNNVELTGVLTDENSVPLGGMSIRILKNNVLVDTVTTNSSGVYSKIITGLDIGTYHFHTSYAGNDVYDNALSETIDVSVVGHTYAVTITTDKQSMLTTESVTVSGTVTRDGTGYAGQSVRIFDSGVLVDTVTTDTNGDYTKTVSNLTQGTHRFSSQFDVYESSIAVVEVVEHNYSINISADNPIIQSGDTSIITATLLDATDPVINESLSYTLTNKGTVVGSGSALTNSNGQITINYVGAGLGDIDVEVSYGTLLQETFVIEDLWYSDPCTSDKGHWSNNNILSFNPDGVCVIGNDSNVSFLDITYPQNYSIECTLTEPNGQNEWTGGLRCGNLGLVGERNKRHYQIMSPYSYSSDTGNFAVNDAIKIIVENGTAKLYYNGVEKKSTSSTSDKFELLGSPSNNYYMRIKDIKIKAL